MAKKKGIDKTKEEATADKGEKAEPTEATKLVPTEKAAVPAPATEPVPEKEKGDKPVALADLKPASLIAPPTPEIKVNTDKIAIEAPEANIAPVFSNSPHLFRVIDAVYNLKPHRVRDKFFTCFESFFTSKRRVASCRFKPPFTLEFSSQLDMHRQEYRCAQKFVETYDYVISNMDSHVDPLYNIRRTADACMGIDIFKFAQNLDPQLWSRVRDLVPVLGKVTIDTKTEEYGGYAFPFEQEWMRWFHERNVSDPEIYVPIDSLEKFARSLSNDAFYLKPLSNISNFNPEWFHYALGTPLRTYRELVLRSPEAMKSYAIQVIQGVIERTVVLPTKQITLTSLDIAKQLNLSTDRLSVNSDLPTRFTTQDGLTLFKALLTCQLAGQLVCISYDTGISWSLAKYLTCLLLKAVIPYAMMEPMSRQMVDNYVLYYTAELVLAPEAFSRLGLDPTRIVYSDTDWIQDFKIRHIFPDVMNVFAPFISYWGEHNDNAIHTGRVPVPQEFIRFIGPRERLYTLFYGERSDGKRVSTQYNCFRSFASYMSDPGKLKGKLRAMDPRVKTGITGMINWISKLDEQFKFMWWHIDELTTYYSVSPLMFPLGPEPIPRRHTLAIGDMSPIAMLALVNWTDVSYMHPSLQFIEKSWGLYYYVDKLLMTVQRELEVARYDNHSPKSKRLKAIESMTTDEYGLKAYFLSTIMGAPAYENVNWFDPRPFIFKHLYDKEDYALRQIQQNRFRFCVAPRFYFTLSPALVSDSAIKYGFVKDPSVKVGMKLTADAMIVAMQDLTLQKRMFEMLTSKEKFDIEFDIPIPLKFTRSETIATSPDDNAIDWYPKRKDADCYELTPIKQVVVEKDVDWNYLADAFFPARLPRFVVDHVSLYTPPDPIAYIASLGFRMRTIKNWEWFDLKTFEYVSRGLSVHALN